MDRFDIAEAHYQLEVDYNVGGILQERPSNRRRNASTGWQLHRMKFKPRRDLSFGTLTDFSQEIYVQNVLQWGLPVDDELKAYLKAGYSKDWLQRNYPSVATSVFGLH